MRIHHVFVHAFGLATILFVMGAAPEEKVANPEYASWAKFKVGTRVVSKYMSETTDFGEHHVQIDAEKTTTLLEITPEKVVLEVKTVDHGSSLPPAAPEKQEVTARIDKGTAEYQAMPRASDDEKLTTTETTVKLDKTYKCKKLVFSQTTNNRTRTRTYVNSDEAPGIQLMNDNLSKKTGDGDTVMHQHSEVVKIEPK